MNIYDIEVEDVYGEVQKLEKYRGKVLLIINSATRCGFTPQYDELQDLYEELGNDDFELLDFPCNQFGNQAPGSNEEIMNFCDAHFGIKFPMFAKIEVNGENEHPLYRYLKSQKGFEGFDPEHPLTAILESSLGRTVPNYRETPDIKWNFTKFLIDRDGNVTERFEPTKDMKIVAQKVRDLISK